MEKRKGIRIVAIAGSVRPYNFTAKALALVVDELKRHDHIMLHVFDPAKITLPFPGLAGDESTEHFREVVAQATGVVLATPEYHGSYSSIIKLVIENLDYPSVLSGKPIALLGVAAGQIGAIKALEHLRSVCSHIGAIVLPSPISVAKVDKLFDKQGRCLDEATEKRIRSVATNLLNYIHNHICPKIALEEMVREQNV